MRLRNHKPVVALLSAVVALLCACNSNIVYSHYEHTPIAGWNKNNPQHFLLSPLRQGGLYREEVGLRINGDYPFMGLTLIVEQQVLPSGTTRSDTLWCKLIDSDGTIQGEGFSYYQYTFHLCDMQLQQGDSLRVSIRHNMKREDLPGISDVGLTLHRIDPPAKASIY